MRYLFIFAILSLYYPALSQKINSAKIDSIIRIGKETHSDGIVIIKDNKVLVEEYYGTPNTPTYIASVSKALTSMAIVKLLSEGKIKSIDQPVADFYPEWKQGNKRFVTLRMLLSHTSGMQNERNAGLELEPAPTWRAKNIIKLALAAELSDKPGTVYSYNNKATALLGGIIEVASGKRMDTYFEEEFFKPMNITEFDWIKDEDGNATAHGAFRLKARDLAKFGQLMLNKGEYNGVRFFEERWVDSSFAQSNNINDEIGLLWWRKPKKMVFAFSNKEKIDALEKAGLPEGVLSKFKTFYNQSFSYEDMITTYGKTFGTKWPHLFDSLSKKYAIDLRGLPTRSASKEIIGYYHTGSWGNFLVIIPQLNLVAVRVVKRDKDYIEGADMFGNFTTKVFELVE
ncbi:MAG TPA: serine hydrolase domain-containing protein [Segetibacter sp.]|jgi:CubicO group peptidase (beta-lactamase class C family)